MKEAMRGLAMRRRELSDGHGDLVAGVAASAAYAVFGYLVAQGLMFDDAKVKAREEAGDAG